MTETNSLEYRPDLGRDERLRTNWQTEEETELLAEDDVVLLAGPAAPAEIGTGLVTATVEDLKGLQQQVKSLIAQMQKDLNGSGIFTFPIAENLTDAVVSAKQDLGLTDEARLTLEDYITALKQLGTNAGQFLVGLIEKQSEDVAGSMQLELFADAVEIGEELAFLDAYIAKGLGSPLGMAFDYTDENWKAKLMAAETDWKTARDKVVKTTHEAESGFREAMLFQPESLSAARAGVYQTAESRLKSDNSLNQLTDVTTLLAHKLTAVASEVGLITQEQKRSVYPKAGDILKPLLQGTDNENAWNKSLTNFSLMLKLAVDKKNKAKAQTKNTLRYTYALANQEKVAGELAVYNETYQNVTLAATHVLNYYDDRHDTAMDTLLNQVAEGLLESEQQKKSKTKEFYLTTLGASSLRDQKIQMALAKDDARQGYQLLEAAKRATAEKGMPSLDNLDVFLT